MKSLRGRLWILALAAAGGCFGRSPFSGADGGSDAGPPDAIPVCQSCPGFTAPVARGTLGNNSLVETSGLASSHLHPGVLYAHNDSGDFPRFFAIDDRGAPLGEFILQSGATAVDWEDIAVGPCPTGSCVYIGDIGDNQQTRTDLAIYRIPEPDVAVGRPVSQVVVPYERMAFSYPQGAHYDAETLMVHPVSGAIYVVTKLPFGPGGTSTVFSFPGFDPASSVVANAIASLPSDSNVMTAGDIHPCGNALLLRSYSRVYRLTLPAGAAFDTIFTQPFEMLFSPSDFLGESIAWSDDGQGYFTTSEGSGQPLYFTGCR